MLIYENHFFNGEDYVSVTSDANRYVVADGEEYTTIWMKTSEEKPCTEGDIIQTTDEIDDLEALSILLGIDNE